jgi:phospholipid/cholesterol/gamma-HCH transport system substrate-binding protein
MTTRSAAGRRLRFAPVGALVLALVAVVVIVAGAGHSYTVRLTFEDAGQLVDGDLVEVGGIPVGTVSSLALTPDGQAWVTVALDRDRFTPLHQGTRASIGTVGLSGVTNRFVALAPGPVTAPAIRSGAVIPERDTAPIVDIDELLDSVTPGVRANLRRGIQEAVGVLHDNVAGARGTLRYAAAAVERGGNFIGQLTQDRAAFSGLLASGAATASAIASRQHRLSHGIVATSSALTAIARARGALAAAIDRAPAVLADGTVFLEQLRPTLLALEPVVRDAGPVALPLARVLRELVPVSAKTGPVLGRLDAILPALQHALARLPGLSRVAVPALAKTVSALRRALPIFTGVRPYGQDILLGILHGYGGGSAENYDANGQFSRIALGLPAPTLLTSVLGFDVSQLSPHFLSAQTDKCPGSAAEPAPDRSNHVVVPGCDPRQVPAG